ncbi:MAG: DUF2065 domain-containing protein [Henriciella sp.]
MVWTLIFAGLGLWLAFEGLMYAAVPDAMKRFGRMLSELPEPAIRQMGLLSMALGVLITYVVLRFGGGL